jgi:polar amino acid transport system substrate-binding protein
MNLANYGLIETGTLLIGVDEAPPAPLNFGTPGSPEFRGFEVDLTQALAARLGLTARYRSALWSVILDELIEGRLDMICGAATITPERSRSASFSDPYLDICLVLVTRVGHPISPLNQEARYPVGVRARTEAEMYARSQAPAAPIHIFELNTDMYDALQAGAVDAVIDDAPIAGYFARTRSSLAVRARLPGTEAQYGIVFSKDTVRLRDAVNAALHELKADGTLVRLRRVWLEDRA